MVRKPVFKTIYNSEKYTEENYSKFERLLIQNILRELKENNLIDAEIFSMSLNLLYSKQDW